MGKLDFLSMEAPSNYVAGLGRGATGFTTRSDLGPAREGPSEEQMKEMLAKRAAQLGQAAPTAYGVEQKDEADVDEQRFQDPDNEVGLFGQGNFDQDDDEADRIWQAVDEKMDKRRRVRREALEQKERADFEAKNPKLQSLFADAKRALSSLSEEDWQALPSVGDLTGRAARERRERDANKRSYAVPDSVLAAAAKSGELDTSIDAGDGTMTNFAKIGDAQKSQLTMRLDSAAAGTQTVAGTSTSVDPRNYMTSLEKAQVSGAEIPVEDLNRARVLLQSAVNTNKNNGPGYVALARLEEIGGKLHAAKSVIRDGCLNAPKSVVVWEEAIRINRDNLQNAKVIAAQAVRQLPKVPSIWLAAADLETTSAAKKKIFRQALDVLPQSVQIWKALINETEDIESVRLLFAKACEEVKLDESLWIGYARVSSSEHAQQVLNQARKAIPTSHNIWIQACRLAEESGTPELCDRIMQRATKALVKDNAMGKRGEWLEKAMECEENQNIITSGSIIKMTIGWGLDEDDDRRDVWLEDAKTAISHGRYYTARAILTHALSVFILSSRLWHALIDLEKTIEQSSESTSDPQTAVKPPVGSALLSTMESAVNACPSSESLWLAYAREIAQRDPDEARKVIARSFNCMPGNENLYLQAVQMEMDNGAIEMARNFLAIARESAATDRIFIKSAVLERNVGELDRSLEMISSGLQLFPQSWKLYAIKGQIYASQGKQKESESAFAAGIRATNSPVLSILLSRLLERSGALIKARSTLDKSRSVHSKNDTLWCEAVRLERRAGQIAAAQRLMANALQLCPHSGLLWAEKIWYLESRTQRKPRALEAIKKVENDAQLFVVVGRIFWSERRLDKAHTWFMKAIQTDSQFGDAWIWYYKFLVEHGTEEKKGEILSKVVLAEPKYGEVWQRVRKDPANWQLSTEEILKMGISEAQ